MRIVVTGSSGHLGEALVRVLRSQGHQPVGLDLLPSPYTDVVASIAEVGAVRDIMAGAEAVIHTATLHKPHIATHGTQAFIDVNISGTANLLDAAVDAGVEGFVFTSTTSAFGRALTPPEGQPAAWITEDVTPVPRNIYGVTKRAAEDLCQLAHQDRRLPCMVLRVARFFPEEDDDDTRRAECTGENAKVNELLHRRVDLADAVSACWLAVERAATIGFGRYVISATTPFAEGDRVQLRVDAPGVVARLYPEFAALYAPRRWKMVSSIDRVYVNARARLDLGWDPTYDFAWALAAMRAGRSTQSDLADLVGAKGYRPPPGNPAGQPSGVRRLRG